MLISKRINNFLQELENISDTQKEILLLLYPNLELNESEIIQHLKKRGKEVNMILPLIKPLTIQGYGIDFPLLKTNLREKSGTTFCFSEDFRFHLTNPEKKEISEYSSIKNNLKGINPTTTQNSYKKKGLLEWKKGFIIPNILENEDIEYIVSYLFNIRKKNEVERSIFPLLIQKNEVIVDNDRVIAISNWSAFKLNSFLEKENFKQISFHTLFQRNYQYARISLVSDIFNLVTTPMRIFVNPKEVILLIIGIYSLIICSKGCSILAMPSNRIKLISN